jgi:phage/plasmid-like protein (TIGR03299 family)
MAHDLMKRADGKYALAYNAKNGLPWHGLGTPVNGAMTWQEAMAAAGLDWSVSKRQLSVKLPGSSLYTPVESWGIFRDDNNAFLGTVGAQYATIQNREAFDFVDSLLEVSGAHYDTAGALFNGEQIFLSATIPYSISPDRAPNDTTNCYLMFTTSHDGSMAATAKLCTVRVVCDNTLNMALNGAGYGMVKVKHTETGTDKLQKAKRIFQGVQQSVETLKKKFDILSERKIDSKASNAIMNKLFGKDWQDSTTKRNQVEKIAAIFDNNDNGAFPEIKGSAYAMLQSVTNWVDHHRTVRQTERMTGLTPEQIRAQAAIFNGGAALKEKALEVIMSATNGADAMPAAPKYFESAGVPAAPKSDIDSILAMVKA